MLRLSQSLLLFLLSSLSAIAAAQRDPISYTLRFSDAAAHYLDVEMTVPASEAETLDLFMPVWTPGSYLVREYSRNIISLEARTANGEALPARKTAKNRWKIEPLPGAPTRIEYRLFCREINVRGNWVETDFAVINGAPTFLSVADDFQRPYQVAIELPANWETTATPLTPAEAEHSYTAPDFDTLVDSPIIAGSPQIDSFEVDGVRHSLVTLNGGGVWDNARAARNVQHLVEAQRDFWNGLPYDQPYVFFNLLTGSRGGLEHKQSLTMTADRWYSSTRGGIQSWLSLVSHEFFHAWNGKRLRPAELGPFEYEHENYTPSLWIVEGITSYYQHVILARAGYATPEQYLRNLSRSIAGTENTPGRLVQSLSDSSFDAWIKAYRPDENSHNALFSYYGGGAVAGFLIDAEIRRASEGKSSLDDVIRAAYERFSGEIGYTETEFIDLASEVAGKDLAEWFDRLVRQPGLFDYQPALDWFGLEFEAPKPPATRPFPLADEPVDSEKGWLGAKTSNKAGRLTVTTVPTGTPAAAAGLSVNDEIIAINQHRLDSKSLTRIVGLLGSGTDIEILISRQGLLLTLPATLGEEPTDTWQLKLRPDATEEQKARVADWLGSPE